MVKIGIILGSTRPNRSGEQVATWVYDLASRRGDAKFELIDLRDYPLPLSLLTEFENYTIFKPGDHTAAWLDTLIDQVIASSTALAPLRTASPAAAFG
jgi:hypothetical protein